MTRYTAGYLIIDGYHRWEVAKRRQSRALKAICRAYHNENEVIEAAFRANLSHGLKASTKTRGDYAYWLHITSPEMPQNEIARQVGIMQGAVSKALARWSSDAMNAVDE